MTEDLLRATLAAIDAELQTNADNAHLWYERGRMLHALGDERQAAESLQKAIRLNPQLLSSLSGEFKNNQ